MFAGLVPVAIVERQLLARQDDPQRDDEPDTALVVPDDDAVGLARVVEAVLPCRVIVEWDAGPQHDTGEQASPADLALPGADVGALLHLPSRCHFSKSSNFLCARSATRSFSASVMLCSRKKRMAPCTSPISSTMRWRRSLPS